VTDMLAHRKDLPLSIVIASKHKQLNHDWIKLMSVFYLQCQS